MTITETTSMAQQLAAAEQAAVAPRQRVAELEAALQASIAAGRFEAAHGIQGELETAREAYAVTDATAQSFRAAAARLDAQRAEQGREIAEAEQRAQAERDLATAHAAEQHALDAISEALGSMRQALASGQRFLRAAQAVQAAVTTARNAANDAQARRGDWPVGHPGPSVARANQVDVLIERDPLIRALQNWSPPR